MTGDWRLSESGFSLHEREFPVDAPVQHVDRRRLEIPEDDDAVAAGVDFAGGIGDRHRFERLP